MFPGLRSRLAACGLLLLAVAAGCAKHTTRPEITDVRLSLDAAPRAAGPSRPVAVSVKVVNAGTRRMWHCEGCGCGNGIATVVLGPDGEPVELLDPHRPVPLCADGPAALDPGGVLEARFDFTGTLYARGHAAFPSPTYPAPPGTYTVIAAFGCAPQWGGGDGIALRQTATFVWQP